MFAKNNSYSGFSLLTTHGMNHPNVSDDTMWTGWSFCNQAKEPEIFANGLLHLPSPRRALCSGSNRNNSTANSTMEYDNNLTFPTKIPNWRGSTTTITTPDEYARAKELYLCQTYCHNAAWQVMFKSGNLDQSTEYLCRKTEPSNSTPFNNLPMNQPLMVYYYHNRRRRQDDGDDDDDDSLSSSYVAGTYDTNPHWNDFQTNAMATALHQYTMDWINYYDDKQLQQYVDDVDNSASKAPQPPPPPVPPALLHNSSYLYTSWKWTPDRGLVYQNMIVTSAKYPWLMNYLRSNDDSRAKNPPGYGGYPWRGAGNLQGPIAANNGDGYKLVLQVRLAIFQQPNDNNNNNNNNRQSGLLFYMPELSGCWKRSDGSPCDDAGDDNVHENLTRYLCFSVSALPLSLQSSPCHVTSPHRCPPWHYSPHHRAWISASNTTHYPYECYHQYCGPYGRHGCDPYSNPIPQELVQLKPCHEWGYYGFPTKPISTTTVADRNALTHPLWHLNIGDLGNALYFYNAKYNDGTQAPKDVSNGPYLRQWISVEVGPEVGIGSARNNDREASAVTRWEISDWDVLMVPEEEWKNRNSIANI